MINIRLSTAAGVLILTMGSGCMMMATSTSKTRALVSERLEAASRSASACSDRAALARDISVNALKNAIAIADAREQTLLTTLGSGVPEPELTGARQDLKTAQREAAEATESTVKVAQLTKQVIQQCSVVVEEVRSAAKAPDVNQQSKGLKKAESHLADADRLTAECEAIATAMKTRWLIPPALPQNATKQAAY